jgi:mandelate racemase
MTEAALTIEKIRARAVNAPLKRQIRTAVGVIPSAPLVLIDVFTKEGVVGSAYIFTYTPATLTPLVKFFEELSKESVGKPVVPVERLREFDRRFRLLGWQGLVGMALSGLDMAFWDALGKVAGWPVVRLLGGEPIPLPAYDSYGAIDLPVDEAALVASVEQGFRAIKIKIGDGDANRDVATVKAVRRVIGDDVALMVDYNQSLNPMEARYRISRLAMYNVEWVEEPVRADDIHGHAQVRAGSPIRIQTGENWYFPREMATAIAAGATDYAMLDVMKIGGVTGWMRASALAEAASLPVSSHTFIEASAHLLAVTPTAHWFEYLDLAGEILIEPCRALGGKVTAKGPGLGLVWDEEAVQRYSV